jgi:sec-independent protein translocase protein TatA
MLAVFEWFGFPYAISGKSPRARHFKQIVEQHRGPTMGSFGVPELLIILAIVVVLFGASRLAGVGKALGTSVRDFRRQVRDDETSNQGGTQAG